MKPYTRIFQEAKAKEYAVKKELEIVGKDSEGDTETLHEEVMWTKKFKDLKSIGNALSKDLRHVDCDWSQPGQISAYNLDVEPEWATKYPDYEDVEQYISYMIESGGKMISKEESLEIESVLKIGDYNLKA